MASPAKFIPILMAIVMLTSAAAPATASERVDVIVGFSERPDTALLKSHGATIKHSYHVVPAIAASLPQQAVEALEKNPRVAYVEPDIRVQALALGDTLPWGVDRIDAEVVHQYNNGSGARVAVLDTGIDYTHPDLDDNYADGYDFANGDADPYDDNGHGTHVAGVIAAENDGAGVVGVAPSASLYALKVLDAGGSGTISSVVAGIEWAVDNDVQVISMSLGADSDSTTLRQACDAAYSNGIVLVAAAGNDGNPPGKGDNVDYPARYDSVIAVSATDSADERPRWSSTGPAVELAAPGVDILSTYPGGYATMSGTSMATPHVAGVAALVIAGGVSPGEARQALQETADDLGPDGWDAKYGYGLVDADEAARQPTHDVAVLDISAPSTTPGSTVNVDVTVANEGTYPESFNVTLAESGTIVGQATVSLDAGVSTIVSYQWNNTTLGDHTLTATVSQVTGEVDTQDNSLSTVVSVKDSQVMRVSAVDVTIKTAGINVYAEAHVYVESSGVPLEDVLVRGHWENATTDTDSGTTGTEGVFTAQSDKVKRAAPGTTYTFVVDEVAKSGYVLDPTSVTSGSASV